MVGRTSNRHTSTSTQAIGLGVLVLVMLASPSSSAPFSHHRPHSLEVQTTPTPKLNVDQPSIHQVRSQTYLEDQLKILYDHLDQQASNSLRPNGGHHPSSAGLNFQSTVHPLNRRKGEEKAAVSRREKERLGRAASKMVKGGGEILQSEMGKRQVEGAYLPNQYAPLAQPQAGAPDPDSDSSQQTISVPMVGRIGAASTTGDSPAATSTPAAVSSASSASASQSPPTQSQSQSQSQSSSDLKPTSSSSPTQSQSSASKTQPSSSSSKSPTSTNAQDQDQDNEAVSVFDKKNHLFPLVAAGIVGAGLFAIILLISIARACAHWRMRSNGGKLDENGNLTGGAGGIKTGRSLRRAITGRKLGSFQRRNREGSVLIEVGDEVFAVPPHIAEEYHRRQKQAANPSANSSVLGRAADSRGLDLQSWRLASAAVPVDGPKRSLSARLMESLRALRGSAEGDDLDDEKTCYSFDSEKQMEGQMRQSNPNAFMPVITKGNGAWNISSSDDSSSDDHHNSHQRQRRFNQGPRETPQLGRPYLPVTPKPQTPRTLSHERVQLSDGPVSTPNVPGGFPGEGRTLQEVKKDEMKKVNRPSSRRNGNGGGGSYRHKKSERPTASDSLSRARSMAAVQRQKSKITSTQHSSPALYTARTQSPPSPKAALQPEKPQRAAKVGEEGRRTPERFRGHEGRANKVSRAPTFRPSLPMPPHLSPIQSSPRIDGWEKKA